VRNRASAGEAISAKISKAAETQFSVTITESKGMCAETNPGINGEAVLVVIFELEETHCR